MSVELKTGEIVGLLGPNGAGKTTSFNMVVGFLKPDTGHVYLDDQEITNFPIYKRARLGIGYLPQEKSVFQKLSVRENFMAIAEMVPRIPRFKRKSVVDDLLDELKLDYLADSKAFTLSGGERRRVEIGRSLILSPSFLLLDEPFSGVDPIAVADLQGIIRQLQQRGIGILITDHNAREILDVVDRAYLLYQGKIMLHGTAGELVNNQGAVEKYFGENFYLKQEVS